jgi:hypothetical protein
MTTLAKIEANRRNAELSTVRGPVEGKALVARNSTTHGIYSNVPVVPGECPEAWETHRTGVVASLAPVGLLEVNLAERAALPLWRLQRLARYEAETVACAMEEVEVPALPPLRTRSHRCSPSLSNRPRGPAPRPPRRTANRAPGTGRGGPRAGLLRLGTRGGGGGSLRGSREHPASRLRAR